MSASAANIKINPINATWEIEEQVCLEYQDIVAADLDGLYYNIYDPLVTYDVHFDVDASLTPNPGAGTAIPVLILSTDTVAQMLTKTQTAIEAGTNYTGRIDGTRLFITYSTTEKVATDAADVDSGILVSVVNKGASTDLGILDGDVEPNFSEDLLDVTGHQFGTSILSQLRQGNNAEVSIVLKESTKALYQEIFGAGGGSFTPPAGTELFGWGDNKQGVNTLTNSRRLVFHPVAKADADHTDDLTFWLAYVNPDSIVYSGENFNVLNVSFTTFLDLSKPKGIRRFGFGDSTQAGISI